MDIGTILLIWCGLYAVAMAIANYRFDYKKCIKWQERFSAIFIFGIFAVLMSGCAYFEQPAYCIDRGDNLCWVPSTDQSDANEYIWHHVERSEAEERCQTRNMWGPIACGGPIVNGVGNLYSTMSWELAYKTYVPWLRNKTYLAHELDHLFKVNGVRLTHHNTVMDPITDRKGLHI